MVATGQCCRLYGWTLSGHHLLLSFVPLISIGAEARSGIRNGWEALTRSCNLFFLRKRQECCLIIKKEGINTV
jgi:hypothetical protein